MPSQCLWALFSRTPAITLRGTVAERDESAWTRTQRNCTHWFDTQRIHSRRYVCSWLSGRRAQLCGYFRELQPQLLDGAVLEMPCSSRTGHLYGVTALCARRYQTHRIDTSSGTRLSMLFWLLGSSRTGTSSKSHVSSTQESGHSPLAPIQAIWWSKYQRPWKLQCSLERLRGHMNTNRAILRQLSQNSTEDIGNNLMKTPALQLGESCPHTPALSGIATAGSSAFRRFGWA